MTGKGSVNHNSRKFHAKNTNPERSYLNIEYINENIEDVYHELFDKALARYNEKQSRKDRCIDNYYEKIRSGKQEKTSHEIILQIGDKDNMGAKTEDGQLAAKILNEYMQDFQQRNPTLRVFSAYLRGFLPEQMNSCNSRQAFIILPVILKFKIGQKNVHFGSVF